MKIKKKKNKSIGEAVAVGTALAGAALGAAAVMLTDKENQKKIKKTIDDISDDAVKLGKNIKKRAEDFRAATQKNKVTSSAKAKPAAKKTVKKTVKKAPVKKSTTAKKK